MVKSFKNYNISVDRWNNIYIMVRVTFKDENLAPYIFGVYFKDDILQRIITDNIEQQCQLTKSELTFNKYIRVIINRNTNPLLKDLEKTMQTFTTLINIGLQSDKTNKKLALSDTLGIPPSEIKESTKKKILIKKKIK